MAAGELAVDANGAALGTAAADLELGVVTNLSAKPLSLG
jgi:hypothetical protein